MLTQEQIIEAKKRIGSIPSTSSAGQPKQATKTWDDIYPVQKQTNTSSDGNGNGFLSDTVNNVGKIAKGVGNFFTSSEQALGETYGAYASVDDEEVNKNRNAVLRQAQRQSNNYLKLAQREVDKVKKQKLLEAARTSAEIEGVDIFNNPEYQKTAKQVWGETAGVMFDVATAGTFGNAAKSAEFGKYLSNEAIKKSLESTIPGFAIKSAIKAGQTIPSSALKVAGKTALEGFGIGTAYGIAGGMQKNKDLAGIAEEGVMGGLTNSLLGGGLSLGISGVSKMAKFGPQNASKKLASNLNEIFEGSTKNVRKKANFVADRGEDLGTLITNNKIAHTVKNERLQFNQQDLNRINNEISSKSKLVDDAVSLYPVKISAEEVYRKAKNLISNNPVVINNGEVDNLTELALKKINDYYSQNKGKQFTLDQLQNFKKAMWDMSKKFKYDDILKSDAYSELGSVFMKIVEDEVPDVAVKKINKEIGTQIQLRDFLEKVNESGGIVLTGGKFSKYISQASGMLTGAGVGSMMGGPMGGGTMGAVVGGAIGSKVASVLRNLSQKSALLGPIDRLLLKAVKERPESIDIELAQKFINDVKEGKSVTPSDRVKKMFESIIFQKNNQKLLEAPAQGAKNVSINVPVNLSSKTTTARESEELANIQKAILGRKISNIQEIKTPNNLLSAPKTSSVSEPIILGAKKDTSKILSQEDISSYYKELNSRFGKDYNIPINKNDLSSIENIDNFIDKHQDSIPDEMINELFKVQDYINTKTEEQMTGYLQKGINSESKYNKFNVVGEEMQNQYQNFKKIVKNITSKNIEIRDSAGLEKVIKAQGKDSTDFINSLYSQEESGDELLSKFKDMLFKERGYNVKKTINIKNDLSSYDRKTMTGFIDDVRLKKSITPDVEIEARALAEAKGLNPDVGNANLANSFDKVLGGGKKYEVLNKDSSKLNAVLKQNAGDIALPNKATDTAGKIKQIYQQSIANQDFMFGDYPIIKNGKLDPLVVKGRLDDVVQKFDSLGIDPTDYKKAFNGKTFKDYFDFDKYNRDLFAKMIKENKILPKAKASQAR